MITFIHIPTWQFIRLISIPSPNLSVSCLWWITIKRLI